MGTDSNRNLIDRLGKVSAPSLQRLRESSDAAALADRGAGPRWARGARVIDLSTGLAGIVQESRRDDQTAVIVFRVQLADLRVVYRTVAELADDAAAVAPPAGTK